MQDHSNKHLIRLAATSALLDYSLKFEIRCTRLRAREQTFLATLPLVKQLTGGCHGSRTQGHIPKLALPLRNCALSWAPLETSQHDSLCVGPLCPRYLASELEIKQNYDERRSHVEGNLSIKKYAYMSWKKERENREETGKETDRKKAGCQKDGRCYTRRNTETDMKQLYQRKVGRIREQKNS